MPDVPSSLADSLLSVNPLLQSALAESQIVDDVLNDQILKKKSPHNSYSHSGKKLESISELAYLPKGRMEPESEYSQRISMTPWLPRLQQIMADRKGAMFSTPPEIKCDNDTDKATFEEWEKHAFGANKSFEYGVAEIADLFQGRGYCGVFIDRNTLPDDVVARGNVVSMQEKVSRKLGEPRLVLFRAEQIYDYETSADGLKWVKVVETSCNRPSWDSPSVKTHTVRIIDAINIKTFVVTENDSGKTVEFKGDTAHGFNQIPFILAAPFVTKQGVGKAQLIGSAQAEVAATRMHSDIVWCLFVLGNPLLTLKTHRDKEELEALNLGASRYIPLKAGTNVREAEELSFVQLDHAGLDLQFAAYHDFRAKIDELAGKDAPGATTKPLDGQSGISKAWGFKTGEERILFLISCELDRVVNRAMDFVAEAKGVDPEAIRAEFNYDFDIESPTESVDVASKILPLITESPTATAEIKKKMLHAVYPDLPNMDEISKELDAGEADISANSTTDQSGKTSPPASTLNANEKELQNVAAA